MAMMKALTSTVTEEGTIVLSVVEEPMPEDIGEDEVLVRIEACPLNPSDLAKVFGVFSPKEASELAFKANEKNEGGLPSVVAELPKESLPGLKKREGKPLKVGNEASGVVIKAGEGAAAQMMMGRVVGFAGGRFPTYSQYAVVKARSCMTFADDVKPDQCCHCFVNPLTVCGFMETMRREGHKALVNTAAASQLGQMLVRVCLKDGVDLVNVVRKQEQVDILEKMGAKYIVNSSSPNFTDELTAALKATGATVAFDCTGGGNMAHTLLSCMEAAQEMEEWTFYGSSVHKQVYLYGFLDTSPTTLQVDWGLSWGVGGWFLSNWLAKLAPEAMFKEFGRVTSEITTTFASDYTAQISLAEALDPAVIGQYSKQATGQKYLLAPWKDVPAQ